MYIIVLGSVQSSGITDLSPPLPAHTYFFIIQISSRDRPNDHKTDFNKFLTVTQDQATAGYVWRVDGDFRTVTASPPTDEKTGTPLQLGVRYMIENGKGKEWKGNCVGKLLMLLEETAAC